VQCGILSHELAVARPAVVEGRRDHRIGIILEGRHALVIDDLGGLACEIRFQAQAQLAQFVELHLLELRRRGIADELDLGDEAVRLEMPERFPDRGLRDAEFARQIVDVDGPARRDPQGHQLAKDGVVNFVGQTLRPSDRAALPLRQF
jgi:hypothetical protein